MLGLEVATAEESPSCQTLYTAHAEAPQELCSLHSERPFLSAHESNAIGGALSILAVARAWAIVETVIPDATVLPYELAPPPRIF